MGKGYACDGMFKLSIHNNNKVCNSVYVIESSLSLWHARLSHVSFRSLRFKAKNGLISYKHDEHDK